MLPCLLLESLGRLRDDLIGTRLDHVDTVSAANLLDHAADEIRRLRKENAGLRAEVIDVHAQLKRARADRDAIPQGMTVTIS